MSEQYMDYDDLVGSIGRKVPYCSGCETAEFDELHPIVQTKDAKGKDINHCPYCGDKLGMRREDRVKNQFKEDLGPDGLARKLLRPVAEAPRDTVSRLFTSPYGKVEIHVSVKSYFAPYVTVNGVRHDAGDPHNWEDQKDARNTLAQIKHIKTNRAKARAIKVMIDETFSTESMMKAMTEIEVAYDDAAADEYAEFINKLALIIATVHRDPNALSRVDLDEVKKAA